jgi:hypothetical protein
MKDSLKRAIYTWRAKNLDVVRAQNYKSDLKRRAWVNTSREFLRILFTEHFPDFKETRGRPKKLKE